MSPDIPSSPVFSDCLLVFLYRLCLLADSGCYSRFCIRWLSPSIHPAHVCSFRLRVLLSSLCILVFLQLPCSLGGPVIPLHAVLIGRLRIFIDILYSLGVSGYFSRLCVRRVSPDISLFYVIAGRLRVLLQLLFIWCLWVFLQLICSLSVSGYSHRLCVYWSSWGIIPAPLFLAFPGINLF